MLLWHADRVIQHLKEGAEWDVIEPELRAVTRNVSPLAHDGEEPLDKC